MTAVTAKNLKRLCRTGNTHWSCKPVVLVVKRRRWTLATDGHAAMIVAGGTGPIADRCAPATRAVAGWLAEKRNGAKPIDLDKLRAFAGAVPRDHRALDDDDAIKADYGSVRGITIDRRRLALLLAVVPGKGALAIGRDDCLMLWGRGWHARLMGMRGPKPTRAFREMRHGR